MFSCEHAESLERVNEWCSKKVSPRCQLVRGKAGRGGVQTAVLDMNRSREVEREGKVFARIERREGILEVKVNGRTEPIFWENTWNEDEETMTGLIFSLDGRFCCALKGKQTSESTCHRQRKVVPEEYARLEESVCEDMIISSRSGGRAEQGQAWRTCVT